MCSALYLCAEIYKVKQKDNPNFAFLSSSGKLHEYYKYLRDEAEVEWLSFDVEDNVKTSNSVNVIGRGAESVISSSASLGKPVDKPACVAEMTAVETSQSSSFTASAHSSWQAPSSSFGDSVFPSSSISSSAFEAASISHGAAYSSAINLSLSGASSTSTLSREPTVPAVRDAGLESTDKPAITSLLGADYYEVGVSEIRTR